MGTVLMVGTRKGLWLGLSEDEGDRREQWRLSGPHFDLEEVYSCLVDTRVAPPVLFAGSASPWTGPQVQRSTDLGATWSEAEAPPRFPEDVEASVERVWQLSAGPGPAGTPGAVWAGTEPGAVFTSYDGGNRFTLQRALWDHPHRPEWSEGFGGQAFHTLLPHPTDPDAALVALSTGGVYATTDGGASWEPRNAGIRAEFLPPGQQFPEFGQCVHKATRHPLRPERLYLQNHGGVYRSDDEGRSWVPICDGLPSDFGFPVVVHPHEPDTLFVFPIDAERRCPPEGHARVWRSRDAGETWEGVGEGLPDPCYVAVLRDAMCADDHEQAGLYLGFRNGEVALSTDDGAGWRTVVRNLPDVVCVRAGRF